MCATEILYWIHNHYVDYYPQFPMQNPAPIYTSDLVLPQSSKVLNNVSLAVMFHQVYDPNNCIPIGFVSKSYESSQCDALCTYLKGIGFPAILGMLGVYVNNHGKAASHGVVAYGYCQYSNGTIEISVSDPNVPGVPEYAHYYPDSGTFNYTAAGFTFSSFTTITPTMISLLWPNLWAYWTSSPPVVSQGLLKLAVTGYTIVIAYGPVSVSQLSATDYFGSCGDSQSFVCGIPGSSGITEGDVEVFAIPPSRVHAIWFPFRIHDPGLANSSLFITRVDNESGQLFVHGCFFNATTSEGSLNYTATVLDSGLQVDAGDTGLNASVTYFSGDMQSDMAYQTMNRQIPANNTSRFTVPFESSLISSRDLVGRGQNAPVNVTITNTSDSAENLNITLCANQSRIGFYPNVDVGLNQSKTVTFNWATSNFAYGKYNITASITQNGNEPNTGNDTYFGSVLLTIQGDVDADQSVTILDIVQIANHYGQFDPPGWPIQPIDIDGDGRITILDLVSCATHYGQKWP
jgi:hypothetical protein